MDATADLRCLAHYLAGEFENRQQALDSPAWYVHLRLWHQPIPHLSKHRAIYFYAEQASLVQLEYPYRPRIFCLEAMADREIVVRYAMLADANQYRGAGLDPQRLHNLTTADFQFLSGCKLNVIPCEGQDVAFQARPPAGARCCFNVDGQTRQVSLGFEAGAGRFNSYDKGIDPTSGKALWGALMGPFQFSQNQDFSDRLPG